MTDKELLEMAAKAAGFDEILPYIYLGITYDDLWCRRGEQWGKWNPITDDRDALRLAVKLGMDINAYPMSNEVGAIKHGTNGGSRHFEYTHVDAFAATRRAIVRAAAEIGKAMK